MRIALGIQYQGSQYSGWQRQKHSSSVQQTVEEALSYVADQDISLSCAGRTDSGVHAVEQVVHFDTEVERSQRSWVLGANTRLPDDIRLLWAQGVSEDFHARFKALARQYRYVIYNGQVRSAIFPRLSCWRHGRLDHLRMNAAAQALMGEHDFTSFRAAGCQAKSPIREVLQVSVQRQEDMVYLDIKANAFLHHMVRNIAGSLIEIGKGDHPVEWIEQLLIAKDRNQAAMTSDAEGLYFIKAFYPAEFHLPESISFPSLF